MNNLFLGYRLTTNDQISNTLAYYRKMLESFRISWAPENNLHLTLFFYGKSDPKKVDKVQKSLEDYSSGLKAMDFEIHRLGVFGSRYQPKVLWWGIQQEAQLKVQSRAFFEYMQAQGFIMDRQNFVPHITLAKIASKLHSTAEFWRNFEQIQQQNMAISWIPTHVDLLQSQVEGNGATSYKTIGSVKLQ